MIVEDERDVEGLDMSYEETIPTTTNDINTSVTILLTISGILKAQNK